jgi:hypothetical protein
MTHLRSIFSLLALVGTFAPTHFAQTVTQSPQTVAVTRPGKIASHYNASNDKTTVVLGFSDVGGESACGLYISANASYPGKTFVSPVEVTLTIMRITPEEKIKAAPLRDLTVTADSAVMNLGVMETASQQTMMDLRWETLQVAVPYLSFLKIANAKNVEAKLGPAKFFLTENNLNFMRQFAGRLKP